MHLFNHPFPLQDFKFNNAHFVLHIKILYFQKLKPAT